MFLNSQAFFADTLSQPPQLVPCLSSCFHLVLDGPPPSAEWSAPVPLPRGAQDNASSGCRPFFMRRTWPSHVHRLLFTSRTMLFIPVRLQISSLHTFSCHLTFNILRKHLPWKPRSLLSNFLLVLHVSEAEKS